MRGRPAAAFPARTRFTAWIVPGTGVLRAAHTGDADFDLEVDLRTATVSHGRLGSRADHGHDDAARDDAGFVCRLALNGTPGEHGSFVVLRVDHAADPAFWLEADLSGAMQMPLMQAIRAEWRLRFA